MVKEAVIVVVVEAVTRCDCAPPSLQLLNRYRVFPEFCGEPALIVWLLPWTQLKVCGAA